MKRLYLLRHAMALPSAAGGDKARKLAPQGLHDAHALGRMMAARSYQPDMVLCSPAVRTHDTLAELMKSLKDCAVIYPEKLYYGGTSDLMEALQGLGDVRAALLVGHNPAIHDLAARLSSDKSGPSFLGRLMQGYSPASLSVLDCPVDSWDMLTPYENTLIDFQDPLDYNAPPTPARWT